jgi:hypothetical protein
VQCTNETSSQFVQAKTENFETNELSSRGFGQGGGERKVEQNLPNFGLKPIMYLNAYIEAKSANMASQLKI